MHFRGITDLLPSISFSLFALSPPLGEYSYWARWEPYSYWARWLYTQYREQGGERDEAENRRHLQCSVKHDSWTLPCAPLTLAITETCGHSQLQKKLGSRDMCPAKNSNSGEEMEKRHWGVESPFYNLANDKKGKWRSICHFISSTKERRFCVSRSWYWFSKWKWPFRREELTT